MRNDATKMRWKESGCGGGGGGDGEKRTSEPFLAIDRKGTAGMADGRVFLDANSSDGPMRRIGAAGLAKEEICTKRALAHRDQPLRLQLNSINTP